MDVCKCPGPCSWRPPPEPPPCPPPPKKPFNWAWPLGIIAFFTFLGLLYKYYNYLKEKAKVAQARWSPRLVTRSPLYPTDLPDCIQYLIVGAGAAGWAAFRAIRAEDPKAMVWFISDEDAMPYQRFPMSRFMWWNDNAPNYPTLDYLENGVPKSLYEVKCECFKDGLKFQRMKEGPALGMASGWEVCGVDADEHLVWVKTVCGERPLYYARCLLATGSVPKTLTILKTAPRSIRERVMTFRTVRDLEHAYQKVRAAKHVTIIGGGPLGTELAWFISRMHKNWTAAARVTLDEYEPVKITLLSKDPGLLGSLLPTYLSEYLRDRVRCCAIDVVPNRQVLDVYESEDNRVQLTLSDGSHMVTDFAFVCIGTEPRVELAERSMLEVDHKNGGFVANTESQIRRHLYTAGDVASIFMQEKGYRMRFDHLTNAIETGTIAGKNMTGLWEPTNIEPHFELKLGKTIEMEAIGEIGACMPTIALYRPCEGKDEADIVHLTEHEQAEPCNIKDHEYMNRYKHGIIFYFRGETIVGMVFWNMCKKVPDRRLAAIEVLRARPTHEDINLIADIMGFFATDCLVCSRDKKRAELALEIPCNPIDPEKVRFPYEKEETEEEKCRKLKKAQKDIQSKWDESEKEEKEEAQDDPCDTLDMEIQEPTPYPDVPDENEKVKVTVSEDKKK